MIWPMRSRVEIIGRIGFVERAADDLDPPGRRQHRQPVDVFRMPRDEPLHQRAAGVQRDRQVRVLFEHVEERLVAVLVRLFEDAVEVADWLMVVEYEDESQRVGHDENSCREIRFAAAVVRCEPGTMSSESERRRMRSSVGLDRRGELPRSYRNSAQCVHPDEPF